MIIQNTLTHYTHKVDTLRKTDGVSHSFKTKFDALTASLKWFYCSFLGGKCKDGLCFSFVKLDEDNQPRRCGKQSGKGVGVCGEGKDGKKLKSSQNNVATNNKLICSV